MSKQPEISYERIVVLNKVLRIPDARFKSGYRKIEVIASNSLYLPEEIMGGNLVQNHIHKVGNKMIQTLASIRASVPLEIMEKTL